VLSIGVDWGAARLDAGWIAPRAAGELLQLQIIRQILGKYTGEAEDQCTWLPTIMASTLQLSRQESSSAPPFSILGRVA
jgi:hypothetical protein